jgi:hypothetical protein
MFNLSFFKKPNHRYYLLVVTIIALTLVIQSITQFSLKKQERFALLINISGKQRSLSQKVLTDFYECRLLKCNYADMKLGLELLYSTNLALQEGDSRLERLEDLEIQKNFDKLDADINYMYTGLKTWDSLETVSFENLSSAVSRFISVMDSIVLQFQKNSEDDIRTLMVVELQLAVISILIILFEIIFIINPAFKKISIQNKKLKEISWHQSNAFNSHIKNIKNLQHVFKIEKNMAHKQELLDCIMDELNNLEQVSENMVNALKSNADKDR